MIKILPGLSCCKTHWCLHMSHITIFSFRAYILGISAKSRLILAWYITNIKKKNHSSTAPCAIIYIFKKLFLASVSRLRKWYSAKCCVTASRHTEFILLGSCVRNFPSPDITGFLRKQCFSLDYFISYLLLVALHYPVLWHLSSRGPSHSSLDFTLYSTASGL